MYATLYLKNRRVHEKKKKKCLEQKNIDKSYVLRFFLYLFNKYINFVEAAEIETIMNEPIFVTFAGE